MFVSFLSYHNIQASKKMERASVFVNNFIHKVLDLPVKVQNWLVKNMRCVANDYSENPNIIPFSR